MHGDLTGESDEHVVAVTADPFAICWTPDHHQHAATDHAGVPLKWNTISAFIHLVNNGNRATGKEGIVRTGGTLTIVPQAVTRNRVRTPQAQQHQRSFFLSQLLHKVVHLEMVHFGSKLLGTHCQ